MSGLFFILGVVDWMVCLLYAQVAPDIQTRALEASFDYAVPPELAKTCLVGTTVLVRFGGREVVGYVLGISDILPSGLNPTKIQPILRVLAPPAFDEVGAELARWLSQEYACPLSPCIRLMLAPGQAIRVKRDSEGTWQLQETQAQAVDDRWVTLLDADAYIPRANAKRQVRMLEILHNGPQRMAELQALVSGASQVIATLEKKGVVEVIHRRHVRGNEAISLSSAQAPRPERLTDGQIKALAAIDEACRAECGDVVVVDGVTGSGKTEVYLDAIECVRAQGKGAIVLVPEISLTAQTVGRFRSRFGDDVAILHSRLSVGERFDQWDLVRQGSVNIVVGARSALFAPLSNVGLIIIDEEHEYSYKQDQAPRYTTRDVAAKLARLRKCALVLGSATPSLEALARSRAGSWRGAAWTRVEMPERPAKAQLPSVEIVDMRGKDAGKSFVFSDVLQSALLSTLERNEKAVLLLNRRGFASFLMCQDCGCVPTCTHCSTALTYHERMHALMCHTCGRIWPQRAYPDPSSACPACGSRYLAQCGVGTQRVEDELHMLLDARGKDAPDVAVIRMDADTTATKGAHNKLLEEFDSAERAVLIGTQMIAKGLDFPEVTLVGVVNADTSLKLPDFRAAERTYNLLEQVSGRAGRGERPGRVIIQTHWATHPAILAVAEHKRSLFTEWELEQRSDAYYPPYSRVANIIITGRNEQVVRQRIDAYAKELRRVCEQQVGEWEVLGPSDCLKARLKDRYRRHVALKAPLDADLGPLLQHIASKVPDSTHTTTLAIDVDANDMM